MKTSRYKVKILFIGPSNVGKSKIANFLSDITLELPEDMRSTESLRIVEFDVNDVEVDDNKADIDVQIWDTSGKESTTAYWPIFRKQADGIVFVYSTAAVNGTKGLDSMYNYFVSQPNFNLRACLACSFANSDAIVSKLPGVFAKVSQLNINLESNPLKLRQEFTKYITSVINTMSES